MIEFTKISIIGFCSIPELELNLNTNSITIIKGATGNGKSSIFSALVWCLYGKNIKGNSNVNTWKKFQPKKYLGTKVEVYFSTGEHIHRVIRCLKYTEEVEGAKGNSRLIYQIDGSEVEDKKKRSIQSVIEHDLGLSYALFLNSIMFGQGLKRLIQESGANQRELFEEVFELGYLSRAQKLAKERYQESNQEYDSLEKDISYKQQTLESINENLDSIKSKQASFKDTQKDQIKVLKKRKSELKAKLGEAKARTNGVDIKALNKEQEKVNKEIVSEKKKLNDAKATLGISLEELVDKIIKLLKKKEYEASLKELVKLKTAFETQEIVKERILGLQDSFNRLSQKIHELNSWMSKLKSLSSQLGDLDEQIQNKKESEPDFDSLIEQNVGKVEKIEKEIKKLKKNQKVYKKSTDLYKWAYTEPLGNSGIKSYLFNSYLEELNGILETYSEVLGFHIKFEVDLESARKDFVTTIQIGSQEVPFEDLSGGQKQLVSLAMAFSMNTMIGRAQGVNISFLDEVFDSLSADKVEIVVELIKKIYKGKTLFLITHLDSLPISNAHIIRVVNDKGLSRYEL